MSRFRALAAAFHQRDAETVARDLLGRYLVRRLHGERLTLRIVETEAYLGAGDRASHAWRGVPTRRTATLFRAGGCAYVYLVYGLHHLFNVVAGRAGEGTAVLVRAGEPVEGARAMAHHRSLEGSPKPGAVAGGLVIAHGEPVDASAIAVGPRIGVDYAGEAATWPLRFAVDGNPHVSRPFPWRTIRRR